MLRNDAGAATLRADVPADPQLVGRPVYLQGFVADPSANALGVAVSPGLEGRFGQRW